MSIYPYVTEQDLISLTKLAEQERESKSENKFLKQTHV